MRASVIHRAVSCLTKGRQRPASRKGARRAESCQSFWRAPTELELQSCLPSYTPVPYTARLAEGVRPPPSDLAACLSPLQPRCCSMAHPIPAR